MELVVVGFVVKEEAERLKRPKVVSRLYAVRQAAEEFAKLYRQNCPGTRVYVSEVSKFV